MADLILTDNSILLYLRLAEARGLIPFEHYVQTHSVACVTADTACPFFGQSRLEGKPSVSASGVELKNVDFRLDKASPWRQCRTGLCTPQSDAD